jgi:hypothetical protein
MPIFKLIRDKWKGRRSEEIITDSPGWSDVQSAVAALDADQHTLVAVEGWGKSEMLIGGGAGKYIVSIATNPDRLFTLINADGQTTEYVRLKAGGQTANYPANEVVDFEKAIQAAGWFCEHNEPDPGLNWKTN